MGRFWGGRKRDQLWGEGKRALAGMEKSDSIIMDPHKGLFLPHDTGAVLVKDAQKLYDAHRVDASYLQDLTDAVEEPSPADLSPELTKHFRGLRLWLPLKLFGTRPFAAALEEKLLLARYFHGRLQEIDGFEVGPPPDLSIVTFRYIPQAAMPTPSTRTLCVCFKRKVRSIFLRRPSTANSSSGWLSFPPNPPGRN